MNKIWIIFSSTIMFASCKIDETKETYKHQITFINAGKEIDAATSLEFINEKNEKLKINSINESTFEMNGTNDSMLVNFSFHDKKLSFGKVPADFFNYPSTIYIAIDQVTPKTPVEWPLLSMSDFAVIQIAKDTDQYIQAISMINGIQLGIDIERLSDFR